MTTAQPEPVRKSVKSDFKKRRPEAYPGYVDPYFLAVDKYSRIKQDFSAPSRDRNLPNILCHSLIIRISRSAWLFVVYFTEEDFHEYCFALPIGGPDSSLVGRDNSHRFMPSIISPFFPFLIESIDSISACNLT